MGVFKIRPHKTFMCIVLTENVTFNKDDESKL